VISEATKLCTDDDDDGDDDESGVVTLSFVV
jgi:hypothetical protein